MPEKEQKMFDWNRFKIVQENLPNVKKAGKGNYGSYMKLDDLNPKMLKLLNENGFAWVTFPTIHEEKPALEYKIVDIKNGESIGGVMPLVMDKQSPQGQGSGLTYARRYALTAITGLVADMDDDGQSASAPETADRGMEEIIALIEKTEGRDKLRTVYAKMTPSEKKIALPIVQEKLADIEVA